MVEERGLWPIGGQAACVSVPGAWAAFRASWPAFLLLALPVGGLYANLALCVSLRRDKQGWRDYMSYPYIFSLACGDLVNSMFIMPTSVVNAFIGDLPGERVLCRTWFSVDLWLSSSMGLHLCLLALDLCLLVIRRTPSCFSGRSAACVRLKVLLAWLLSAVTALCPLVWHYAWCPSDCIPTSIVFSIVSSCVCFFVPMSFLACCVIIAFVTYKKRATTFIEDSQKALSESIREKEIETLQQAVNTFTSISADVDLQSMLSTEQLDDTQHRQQSFVRKLSVRGSQLSRRLSSRRNKTMDNKPTSPKLDRHPSLRYSIKRNASANNHKKRQSSIRGSVRRKEKTEQTSPVPLLFPDAASSNTLQTADSKETSAVEEDSRTPEDLDDRTICNMLLAENASSNRSSFKSRSGSKRGSRRRSKKSLNTHPASPTLDRHPSLRYSIKRPRTPRPDAADKGSSSIKRSPSTRSQRSFFSRTPSVRSNVSRTPSQYSSRSPYNASPQTYKMSSLMADYQPQAPDSVFTYPETAVSSVEASPLLNHPEIMTPEKRSEEVCKTTKATNNQLPSPVLVLQTATPKKTKQNGQSDVGERLDESMMNTIARANSIESLDDVVVDEADGEGLKNLGQVLRVLTVLSLAFVFSHLPSNLLLIWETACLERQAPHCSSPGVHFSLQWLAYLCSLLNPLIVFSFHRNLFQKLRT